MSSYSDEAKSKEALSFSASGDNQNQAISPFNFYGQGIKFGLIGGVIMALFLFALSYGGVEESMGLKFLKYILLGGVLVYALNVQKNYLGEKYQFKKGMLFGLFVTISSAVVLVLSNLLLFTLFDSMSFDKFSMEADSTGNFLVISGIVFFETLVYGMILTFIILQYLKTKKVPGAK